jgi:hypothetical protein
MSHLVPRLATILVALSLTVSGIALGAGAAPTLPHPIAPFGCYT